jgi:hypothetical protein
MQHTSQRAEPSSLISCLWHVPAVELGVSAHVVTAPGKHLCDVITDTSASNTCARVLGDCV